MKKIFLGFLLLVVPFISQAFTVDVEEGQIISSPFAIVGSTESTAGWLAFEGQVGSVTLTDSVGATLYVGPLSVDGDWMHAGPHEFSSTLIFETDDTHGFIIFRNENISGEGEDIEITVPVVFESNKNEIIFCTEQYMPVCGEKQVQCVTTPCDPIQETYPNRCYLDRAGASFVHEGECGSGSVSPDGKPFTEPTAEPPYEVDSHDFKNWWDRFVHWIKHLFVALF